MPSTAITYNGLTPPPNPKLGDLWINSTPHSLGQIMVFDGMGWLAVSEPEEIDLEAHCRFFAEQEERVFEEHEDLKELWDEYMLTRRLKLGR